MCVLSAKGTHPGGLSTLAFYCIASKLKTKTARKCNHSKSFIESNPMQRSSELYSRNRRPKMANICLGCPEDHLPSPFQWGGYIWLRLVSSLSPPPPNIMTNQYTALLLSAQPQTLQVHYKSWFLLTVALCTKYISSHNYTKKHRVIMKKRKLFFHINKQLVTFCKSM